MCLKCKLSYLHTKTRFCSVCHYRTRAGDVWQEKATKLQRQVFAAFEKSRKDEEVAESDLFDEETDKPFEENMLMDDDSDQTQNIAEREKQDAREENKHDI
ncbi:unnamed protein product [Allacma fusca]|uniref:Uncharacterized protein n=1 Tax=Allacma fusca TaxID=39272 RepID=A0A8J2L8J9_9HEXA|nr:unnamed protein product [Allacma fusca]